MVDPKPCPFGIFINALFIVSYRGLPIVIVIVVLVVIIYIIVTVSVVVVVSSIAVKFVERSVVASVASVTVFVMLLL